MMRNDEKPSVGAVFFPLPPGEGRARSEARRSGEGSRDEKVRRACPHPRFGHPLPGGEGPCSKHTIFRLFAAGLFILIAVTLYAQDRAFLNQYCVGCHNEKSK